MGKENRKKQKKCDIKKSSSRTHEGRVGSKQKNN